MVYNKFYNLGMKNVKICLISDIHFDKDYNLNIFEEIIKNIKENKPNFICISGDILDHADVIDYKDIINLKTFIVDLASISSVIISLGNHDITSIKNEKCDFEKVNNWFLELNKIENVYYLNNKSLIRNDLCFTSYNPSYEYYGHKEDINFLINDIDNKITLNKKYYNILLFHSPINILENKLIINSSEIKKSNLILSGHMHNGLILNIFDKKGNRGIIGPYFNLFPKNARGIITKNIEGRNINLVISGGVVKISNISSKFLRQLNKLFKVHIEYINI